METMAAHLTHTSPNTHQITYLLYVSRLKYDAPAEEVCTNVHLLDTLCRLHMTETKWFTLSELADSHSESGRLRSIGAGSGVETYLPAVATGSFGLELLSVHYGMEGKSASQAQQLCICLLQYPINLSISQSISPSVKMYT